MFSYPADGAWHNIRSTSACCFLYDSSIILPAVSSSFPSTASCCDFFYLYDFMPTTFFAPDVWSLEVWVCVHLPLEIRPGLALRQPPAVEVAVADFPMLPYMAKGDADSLAR